MPDIAAQIDQSAGYYAPQIYANLLTFYHNYAITNDPASGQFIPVAPRQGTQLALPFGLFAVGILPPAVNVTGRLLDRSASVAGPTSTAEIVQNSPPETVVTDLGVSSAEGNNLARLLQDKQFWVNYVVMCKSLGVKPEDLAKVIQSESSWNPNATYPRKGNPVAKGLNQLQKGPALAAGMSPETWDKYESLSGTEQLPYLAKTFKGCSGKSAAELYSRNAGGYNLPGFGFGYMSKKRFYNEMEDETLKKLTPADQAAIEASVKKAGFGLQVMFKQFNGNPGADNNKDGILGKDDLERRAEKPLPSSIAAAIAAAQNAVAGGATWSAPVPGDSASGTGWNDRGSQASQKSTKQQSQLDGSPLTSSQLGKDFLAAQANQIKETQAALDKMRRCPPLAMRINPASFSVKGEKIVNDGNWGRNGPIIEYWGDNQDKISGSGKSGGFYAIDVTNANGPGITRWARNFSASWQNIQSLYLLYRSNGALFLKDGLAPSFLNLSLVGSIYIYYDGTLYIGSFDSFNLTEDASAPFTAEYSFEFTVRAAFFLAE